MATIKHLPKTNQKRNNLITATVLLYIVLVLVVKLYGNPNFFGLFLNKSSVPEWHFILGLFSVFIGCNLFLVIDSYVRPSPTVNLKGSILPIDELVQQFESGRLPKQNWHHSDHLRIILYYLYYEKTYEDALIKMRCGLIRYGVLRNPQIDCTQRYNETITVFWTKVLYVFLCGKKDEVNSFPEIEKIVCCSDFRDPEYIYQCYEEEEIYSSKFRSMYVVPTKNPWLLEPFSK